ncbi:MAG TPA: class I SAM-dependent methyltransferase [Oligoflexia bacterium]|nr:class I SAM-dependent methyltransferase [Oligoflexia bacterium]
MQKASAQQENNLILHRMQLPDGNEVSVVVASNHEGSEVPITGEYLYPIPHALHNLQLQNMLSPRMNHYWFVQGWNKLLLSSDHHGEKLGPKKDLLKKYQIDYQSLWGEEILSLAEGRNAIVLWMNQLHEELKQYLNADVEPIQAVGVDLIYGEANIPEGGQDSAGILKFRNRHKNVLRYADVTKLEEFSEDTDRFQLIFGHYIFKYLSSEGQKSMLKHALRLVKPGGTIRFNDVPLIIEEVIDPKNRNKKIWQFTPAFQQVIAELKQEFNFDYIVSENWSPIYLKSISELSEVPQTFEQYLNQAYILPRDVLVDQQMMIDYPSRISIKYDLFNEPYLDRKYEQGDIKLTELQKIKNFISAQPVFINAMTNRTNNYSLIIRKKVYN